MLSILVEIFERDLNKLAEEIKAYPGENDIWKTWNGITNSTGNLTLHLIGNLNHFIGATLGKSAYVRNRENEFSLKNISAKELIDGIKDTILVIKQSLQGLSEDDLTKPFPVPVNNKISSTQFILIHLVSHLDYHLGQINYHRRLLQ